MALSWGSINNREFPTFSQDMLQYNPGRWEEFNAGGDNGMDTRWVDPSWGLAAGQGGIPDWWGDSSNVSFFGDMAASQAAMDKFAWNTGGGDNGNSYRDPAEFYKDISANNFGGIRIKSGDKEGTYVPYKLVDGMWTPDFANATRQAWNTNSFGYNDPGFLAVVTAALGGAAGAAMGGGAGAGAGGFGSGAGGTAGGAGLTAGGSGLAGAGMGGAGSGITIGGSGLAGAGMGGLGSGLGATGLGGAALGSGLGLELGAGMSLGDWLAGATSGGTSSLGQIKEVWDRVPSGLKDALKDTILGGSGGSTTNSGAKPGGTGGSTLQDILDKLLGGSTGGGGNNMNMLGLLGAMYSAKSNEQLGDKYAEIWNQMQGQAKPFMDKLQESYTNPNAYLESPEFQSINKLEENRLARNAAAGGRLSNDVDRATLLQNFAQKNLGAYRNNLQSSVDATQRQLAAFAPMFIQSQQNSLGSLAPYFAAMGQGGAGGNIGDILGGLFGGGSGGGTSGGGTGGSGIGGIIGAGKDIWDWFNKGDDFNWDDFMGSIGGGVDWGDLAPSPDGFDWGDLGDDIWDSIGSWFG